MHETGWSNLKKWWDHLSLSVKHLSSISPCLSSACLGSGWFGGSLAKSSFIHSLLFITHQLYGFFLVYCVHELFNSLESTQFSLHAWYTPSFFFKSLLTWLATHHPLDSLSFLSEVFLKSFNLSCLNCHLFFFQVQQSLAIVHNIYHDYYLRICFSCEWNALKYYVYSTELHLYLWASCPIHLCPIN